MKADIHPKWFADCKVTCACGNVFTIGAVVPELQVEICSKCHPYFTGQMKYIDTAGRVEAFKARRQGAKKDNLSKADKRKMKREKKISEELSRPDTLEAIRKQAKAK